MHDKTIFTKQKIGVTMKFLKYIDNCNANNNICGKGSKKTIKNFFYNEVFDLIANEIFVVGKK